tara:strand:+ start:4250 stop:5125 length:876 start_codon:yes stop_codon:yes gene_type:complete
MASTFTTNTGIEKPGVGEQSGTWGTTTNENFDIIDRALNGVTGIALTTNSDTSTLNTDTTSGALSDGMFKVLQYTGTLDSAHTVTITPNTAAKVYLVFNNTSGSQNLIFSQGTGANATIVPGETAWIYADGGAEDAIVRRVELSKLTTALDVNGQNITSASNGNVVIAPNGTGDVQLDADTVRVGDSGAAANIASNGDNDLILKTGNSTTGTMQITDGANGNITLAPNGTGFVGVPNILFSTTATDTNSNNWEIKLSGGNLFFAYNNVNKMKLDTSGNLTVVGDVTAAGSL